MKTGPDTLVFVEIESGHIILETGPDALRTAEKVSESAKYENGTKRPRYRRKHIRERKT
jgi:hypothetical protein